MLKLKTNEKENLKNNIKAKSFTSLYDLIENFPYRMYNNSIKDEKIHEQNGNIINKKTFDNHSRYKQTQQIYITSEKYYKLNRNSSISLNKSTSTIFYNLDNFVKQQCFDFDLGKSKTDVLLVSNKDNKLSNALKKYHNKKKKYKEPELSSENASDIYDCYYTEEKPNNLNDLYNNCKENQIYINRNRKKLKNNCDSDENYVENNKNIEKDESEGIKNPCPCQLFSYACPCTDNKSLTQLAKSNRSKHFIEKMTGSNDISHDIIKDNDLNDKQRNQTTYVCERNEPITVKGKENEVDCSKTKRCELNINCPNCRRNIKIVKEKNKTNLSDDSNSNKSILSSLYVNTILPPFATPCTLVSKEHKHSCKTCEHNPKCEISQYPHLNDQHKVIQECARSNSPKIIRISKACRHQPPCIVVPSCRRAAVIENNCGLIPSCFHKPRCINLPLCTSIAEEKDRVQFTSDGSHNKNVKCCHMPQILPNYLDPQFSRGSERDPYDNIDKYCAREMTLFQRTENSDGYDNIMNNIRPKEKLQNLRDNCIHIDKSCQYSLKSKSRDTDDGIIFIRDVGCQFRTKWLHQNKCENNNCITPQQEPKPTPCTETSSSSTELSNSFESVEKEGKATSNKYNIPYYTTEYLLNDPTYNCHFKYYSNNNSDILFT